MEKQVDVALAVDMVAKATAYDVAIIVSGDEDFVPAARVLKVQGKSVEVAAFRSQRSAEWDKVADRIWTLDLLAPQISR